MDPFTLLLLFGGGFLLSRKLRAKKKSSGVAPHQSGMKLVDGCNVEVVNEKLYHSYMQGMGKVFEEWPPKKNLEESFLTVAMTYAFPQCTWPPPHSWTIEEPELTADWGSWVALWTERFDELRDQAGA